LPTLTRTNVTIDCYTEPGALAGNFGNRILNVQIIASLNVAFEWTILASNIVIRGFDFVGQFAKLVIN
jgi:hypothetical protein